MKGAIERIAEIYCLKISKNHEILAYVSWKNGNGNFKTWETIKHILNVKHV